LTRLRLRFRRTGAILLAAAAAVSIPIGLDSGDTGPIWFTASGCLGVLAVTLWCWSTWAANRRNILPSLTPHTLAATVVEVTNEVYRQNENSAETANRVHVAGELRGVRWKATIADAIAEPSLNRFEIGSRWLVRGFEGNPHWVALASDHDDVIRQGYWLKGPTEAEEDAFFPPAPGPGSDIALVTRPPGAPPPIWRRPAAVRWLSAFFWVLGSAAGVFLGMVGWLALIFGPSFDWHQGLPFIDEETSAYLQFLGLLLLVVAPAVDGSTARRRWSKPWWSGFRAAGIISASLGGGELLRALLEGGTSLMTGFLFIAIGAFLLLIQPTFAAVRGNPVSGGNT